MKQYHKKQLLFAIHEQDNSLIFLISSCGYYVGQPVELRSDGHEPSAACATQDAFLNLLGIGLCKLACISGSPVAV
jgi:hypothetical protein